MQIENPSQSFGEKMVTKVRQSPTIRLMLIGILILILLIPSSMIQGLIYERQTNHDGAVNEISDKWGRDQTITGPILAVPYTETRIGEQGKTYTVKTYAYYLPDNLQVTGDMSSEKKHRGIYEAVLYTTKLKVKGDFSAGFMNVMPALPSTANLAEAKILVGITDVRGIRNKVAMQWNGTTLNAQPGVVDEILNSGINFPLNNLNYDTGGSFEFDLELAGSQSLYFTPVGKNNMINIASNWPDPSFDGAFLPTNRSVDAKGFKADWKVLELNRNIVHHWNGENEKLRDSDFGVKMKIAADQYQKTHRSVKYCVLFISLTFIFFFIIELKARISVHPVQYLLIGLAISIFYLLLLSLSEWMEFNTSYFISAAAVTTLISLFSISVLGNKLYSAMTAVIQVLLYLFLFTTLQLEDLSLLIGSIGLFLTLAILMYFSRRLNREDDSLPQAQ
jgi:inner membrane protein